MIGRTFDHYRIESKLGEGGMGVVYRAKDTHLDRSVAIKIVPPGKVHDPARKERFVQEAKAASALNHPNIVTIHDIRNADGTDFIVMEYVEGKTLDELIQRGGLRPGLALRYAIQIADAMAKAHGAGTANPALRQVLIDDVPLQRVAQPGRIPMMELLVRHGADVNGLAWGWFPALFTPCENIEPEPLQWLLDHGADPNRGNPNAPGTALDYVIETYPRDPKRLTACIEILLAAGAHTRYGDVPGVLPLLRGRTDELAALLDADPALLHRLYPELHCGPSGGRLLTLRGATLLHVAAEYGFFDASRLLLDRGADVNARADIDTNGVGGQTPIFHALTHFKGVNPEVAQLLIARGADLTVRARVPGHYERPGEILDVSAAEYAALFPLR